MKMEPMQHPSDEVALAIEYGNLAVSDIKIREDVKEFYKLLRGN